MSRNYKKNKKLNRESKSRLNESIENSNKKNTAREFSFLNFKALKNSNSSRKNFIENFALLTRFSNLSRKNSQQHQIEIQTIDTQISIPIVVVPTVDDETNFVYTKESLLKRFTNDYENLDKDLHFEFCV